MRSGASRRSLRFERASGVGGTGQKNGWQEIVTTRAQTKKRTGGEGNNSAAETAISTYVFRVRYQSILSDLNVRDRFVDVRSGEVYDITDVENLKDKNRELEITATAIR